VFSISNYCRSTNRNFCFRCYWTKYSEWLWKHFQRMNRVKVNQHLNKQIWNIFLRSSNLLVQRMKQSYIYFLFREETRIYFIYLFLLCSSFGPFWFLPQPSAGSPQRPQEVVILWPNGPQVSPFVNLSAETVRWQRPNRPRGSAERDAGVGNWWAPGVKFCDISHSISQIREYFSWIYLQWIRESKTCRIHKYHRWGSLMIQLQSESL